MSAHVNRRHGRSRLSTDQGPAGRALPHQLETLEARLLASATPLTPDLNDSVYMPGTGDAVIEYKQDMISARGRARRARRRGVTDLGTISGTQIVNNMLKRRNRTDTFLFNIASRTRVSIQLDDLDSDADLQLLDGEGNGVALSSAGGTSVDSISRDLNAGSYKVVVRQYDPLSRRQRNTYRLTFSIQNRADDHGNVPSAATAVGVSRSTPGNIERASDTDYFKFTAKAGRLYELETSLGSLSDSVLSLYDRDGATKLADNDDGGAGYASRITWMAAASGTYYLQVRGYNATQTGTYSLRISEGIQPQPEPQSGSGDYDIQFIFTDNNMTSSQRAAFEQAAQRWERIITNDLPDVRVNRINVDDLMIEASAPSIDGVGGVLGSAGPTHLRTGSSLPSYGRMRFDSADLNRLSQGRLVDLITHEMGHVIGIGTIWNRRGVLRRAGTSNPTFIGANALREYNRIFNTDANGVPVANTGGRGTRDAHWRESVFGSELMTGYLDGGTANRIGRVTIGSLQDIGYEVNYNAAETTSRS